MIKTILVLIAKVLESKLVKSGVEEIILKNQNYITVAKQVWNTIEENFRITEKVEDKLKSKADEFDKMLLIQFPELTQSDVVTLRQSIAGEVNKDKQAVVDNSALLQQLQTTITQLQAENAALKNKISQIQSTVAIPEETTNVNQQAVQA
ncbi:hypothetical protein [Clostridium saccharobutylicum]|uniref:Uncharacterized protein n=1 Tax=Clostridium saccharobutylicum DSM 13864 TaxID=1345695 RepID=U5MWY2_CLOSA|nr:hypothetical protein [Clostridium saccharobutylicum]AGX43937.1 hypothetical protein CLSA_c29700 [Clostridium saccharobutylicum DSM 13864]AQR91235.1 hypothetical protein CLOSC_29590 [Clostridium saccharobutylicum]AQS01139.1 hypothetical protein CSACC_29660 [Clostridium saccharobutylicum]AQS15122.1 hypothetical protein CLOSACC_29660 [Clostridium saccharobutylicum]MBA2905248.1 hypothetical protein [Clostridium saccharobutylicum]